MQAIVIYNWLMKIIHSETSYVYDFSVQMNNWQYMSKMVKEKAQILLINFSGRVVLDRSRLPVFQANQYIDPEVIY